MEITLPRYVLGEICNLLKKKIKHSNVVNQQGNYWPILSDTSTSRQYHIIYPGNPAVPWTPGCPTRPGTPGRPPKIKWNNNINDWKYYKFQSLFQGKKLYLFQLVLQCLRHVQHPFGQHSRLFRRAPKASHPQQFRFFHSFPVEPIELLDVLERLLPLSPFQFQLFLKTCHWSFSDK